MVTGGGWCIGQAYWERLAAEGANVVVVNKDDATPIFAALAGVGDKMALTCDVGDTAQIQPVAAAVLQGFGRCDIFVDNAAYMPMTTLDTVTSEVWRRVQATNVEAIVHFAKAFVPGMAAAGWGRIVTTGSSSTLHPRRLVTWRT